MTGRPHVFVIAGPNGAGKSTAASALLRDLLGVAEYVSADLIAQGLSAFDTVPMRGINCLRRTDARSWTDSGRARSPR